MAIDTGLNGGKLRLCCHEGKGGSGLEFAADTGRSRHVSGQARGGH